MIVSGYSIDMVRNISGYRYPDKLSVEEKRELRDNIISGIAALNLPLKYIPSYLANQTEIDYMQEENLLSMNVSNGADPSLLIDEKTGLVITINDNDHMLISTVSKKSWDECYNQVTMIDKSLNNIFDIQRDRTFGYLSASTPLSGYGMIYDSMIHLPALMNKNKVMNSVEKIMKRPGGLLIPYNNMTRPSAFFVLRLIVKQDPKEDLEFAKNLSEEMSIMEEAEVEYLKHDEDFVSYIENRVKNYIKDGKVQFADFLRVLDDVSLYAKVSGVNINGSDIANVLISTQPEHLNRQSIDEKDVEKFYFDRIMSLLPEKLRSI